MGWQDEYHGRLKAKSPEQLIEVALQHADAIDQRVRCREAEVARDERKASERTAGQPWVVRAVVVCVCVLTAGIATGLVEIRDRCRDAHKLVEQAASTAVQASRDLGADPGTDAARRLTRIRADADAQSALRAAVDLLETCRVR